MKCRACRQALPPTSFYVGRSVLRCRPCTSACRRRKIIKDPLALVVARAEKEALKQKVPCTITSKWTRESWRVQNGRCFITGLRMELYLDRHHPLQAAITLVDPQKEYVDANTLLVIKAFALFKGSLSLREALALWEAAVPRVAGLAKTRNDAGHAELVELFRGTALPPALIVHRATA